MKRYLYEDNYKYLYSQDIYTPSYKCNNEYIHYLGCVDIYNEQELEDFVELIEKVGYNREKILKG